MFSCRRLLAAGEWSQQCHPGGGASSQAAVSILPALSWGTRLPFCCLPEPWVQDAARGEAESESRWSRDSHMLWRAMGAAEQGDIFP